MINKFYIMHLAPKRSGIEHLVEGGWEVFTVPWRIARAEHHDWGLDAYPGAVLEAFEAGLDSSGCTRAHMLGYCAGGLVTPRPSFPLRPAAGSSRPRASPSGSASSTTSAATS